MNQFTARKFLVAVTSISWYIILIVPAVVDSSAGVSVEIAENG
jgi:hypothetical protein